MKRSYFRMFVVSLGAALLAVAAFANDPDRLIVDIPYGFVANGESLPAGTYTVRRLSDFEQFSLALTSRDSGKTIYLMSNEVEPKASLHGSVTFLVTGDQHFLTRIKTAEHTFSLPVSSATFLAKSGSHKPMTTTSVESRN